MHVMTTNALTWALTSSLAPKPCSLKSLPEFHSCFPTPSNVKLKFSARKSKYVYGQWQIATSVSWRLSKIRRPFDCILMAIHSVTSRRRRSQERKVAFGDVQGVNRELMLVTFLSTRTPVGGGSSCYVDGE